MNFLSDNRTGASSKILQAVVSANSGTAEVGEDILSRQARQLLSEVFDRDIAVFFVPTGTAANGLSLAAIAPPGSGIFCHEEAHVMDSECGASEFFSSGAKLIGIPGHGGKICPLALKEAIARIRREALRQVPPAALSLSQATESGTVYTSAEISTLSTIAHEAGMRVHVDGARFANALVKLGGRPADLTWKAGVDILSFGATKNGALACEAVILFDKESAGDFAFRRKRAGHTLSKGRLLGAQMRAYLDGGHWLDLARAANRAAARLSAGLRASAGVRCPWPQDANEVFAVFPRKTASALTAAGALFNDWSTRSMREEERPGPDEIFLRLVCSFQTADVEIDDFLRIVKENPR